MMKTRSIMMKKCRNLKNEIKTRWGDSINLLYCSHIINKSRRSHEHMKYRVVHDRILIVRLVESLVTLYITKITKVLIIAHLLVDLCKSEAEVDMRGFFVFFAGSRQSKSQ